MSPNLAASLVCLIFRSAYCGRDFEPYTIPVDMVEDNQVCVAVYPDDNNWHRCVVKFKEESSAFVDVR